MDLYLVRHAAAFRRDRDRWPRGSRRPLTPEGEEEFRLAARGLARIVPRVDVILSSPNQRTWHTAEILSELDSWPAPEPSPALRTGSQRGSPEKVTLALEDYAEAKSVAVVGHKPRLQELAAYLLTGERDGMDIKINRQRDLHLLRRRPCAGNRQAALAAYARSPALSSRSALQLVSISAFPLMVSRLAIQAKVLNLWRLLAHWDGGCRSGQRPRIPFAEKLTSRLEKAAC